MGEIVGTRDLLGDDHAPGVDDELAGLARVQCRKIRVDPVEAQVRRRRQLELLRLAATRRPAPAWGTRTPSRSRRGRTPRRRSARRGTSTVPDVHLVGALQLFAQRPDVLDHRHDPLLVRRTHQVDSAGRPDSSLVLPGSSDEAADRMQTPAGSARGTDRLSSGPGGLRCGPVFGQSTRGLDTTGRRSVEPTMQRQPGEFHAGNRGEFRDR